MISLSPDEQNLLRQLFAGSQGGVGVDALAFRADNYSQIDRITSLEATGFIRRENDRYFVSLTAIVQLDSDRARTLMVWAEGIFAELKAHYMETQREPVKIERLAKLLDLTPADVCETLSYMVEGSWWASRSNVFTPQGDSYIQPAEQILQFRRFLDVVKQLQSWQVQRVRDRQRTFADALLSFDVPPEASPTQQTSTDRRKPDWFSDLPSSTQALLGETYSAHSIGLKALTAMGIRAVLDDLCLELVGDVGGFSRKLSALRLKGLITEIEEAVLSAAIDVGNASAHRGHVPHESDLITLFDIAEHALRAHYILPKAAERLKANTPERRA